MLQQLLHGNNEIFSAGAGLIGLGAGMAVLRAGGKQAFMALKRKYLTTLELPSHDKAYDWFMMWMQQHCQKQCRQLSVRTQYRQHDNGSISTSFMFMPGRGMHYFQYSNVWFQVERLQDKGIDSVQHAGILESRPREMITLRAITQDTRILESLLNECRQFALQGEEGRIVLYTAIGPEWRPFGQPRRRRPLKSVILRKGMAEAILNDITEFLDTQRGGKWYIDKGIPYRRGYLLHGNPGSGKSSFIYALASYLEYNIAIVNLAEKWMSDDRLALLFATVPAKCVILLEDVDAAFAASRTSTVDGGNNLTFSGLLNALDGVTSSEEGRLIFMTTNHRDRLDPALMRPGRVDFQAKVDDATCDQVFKMFVRFYGEETVDLANAFLGQLSPKSQEGDLVLSGLSMAQLQGYMILHKDDPIGALEDVIALKQAIQNR